MIGYRKDKFYKNVGLEYVKVEGSSCQGNRSVIFYINGKLEYV